MTTKTAQFTPGPWKWNQESVDPEWAVVTSQGGDIIANVNSETGPDIPPLVSTKMPQHANAALIAAAPAMYEALRMLTSEINLSTLNVRKDFSLMNAHACAVKAILQAEGKLL